MKKHLGLIVLLLITLATTAHAADFSFTGNFAQDDNVQLFNFSVGVASNITLETWSYAGGTNAAGQLIARGGFDPILALFDSTGALIDQNDDGGCGSVALDLSGQCYDTFFQSLVGPGNYTAAVMQFDNFANGPTLADGFSRVGQGNFTAGFASIALCPDQKFCDVSGSAFTQRDDHWAFDILNVGNATQAPEPSSVFLLFSGLVALGGAGYRRAGSKLS